MRGRRGALFLAAGVVAVLALAFWFGGAAPGLQGWTVGSSSSGPSESRGQSEVSAAAQDTSAGEIQHPEAAPAPGGEDSHPAVSPPSDPKPGGTGQPGDQQRPAEPERQQTPPPTKPEETPLPGAAAEEETAYSCTLSVSCATILDNLAWLTPEKAELVPEDGILFPTTEVTFYQGENVFQLLRREMKTAKIHMESVDTPLYHSAYLEGIGNLYQFDCGEQSGWMYRVNGEFPDYGCSRYLLHEGDAVEWVYTCDQGADVGGSNFGGNQP